MKKLVLFVITSLIVTNIFAQKNSDLARVGILNFVDKTNSQDYQYLSKSLAEAIDKSMHKKFEYIKANPAKTQSKANEILKDNEVDDSNAKKVTKSANLDILIAGSYRHQKSGNLIKINTSIYLVSAEQYIELEQIKNPVDSTIFQATEKVASLIVDKISQIAAQQQENESKAKKPNEKIKIRKEIKTSWYHKTEEMSFYLSTLKDRSGSLGSMGVLGFEYRLNFDSLHWLQWGLGGGIIGGKDDSVSVSLIDTTTSAITTGTGTRTNAGILVEGIIGAQYIFTDRIKSFVQVAPGYMGGITVLSANSGTLSNTTNTFGTFGGLSINSKLGFEFLLLKSLTIDLYANVIYLKYANNSLFAGGGIGLTFAH